MIALTPSGLALVPTRNGHGCCGARLEGFLDDPIGWVKQNWMIAAAAGVLLLILILRRR
jgi:hypothetical protein